LHFFKFRNSGFQVFKSGISFSDPLLSPFFYMHTPETLEFINTDAHTNTNKNMTFEFLKVCWPANPHLIELRVMYARSTVTDRYARWAIINQNYCIKNRIIIFLFLYFVLFSLVNFFYYFFSFHFLHISLFRFVFVDFVLLSLVSFCFRWFRFVLFRFYFVSHLIGALG
jgi:hypothetical protein